MENYSEKETISESENRRYLNQIFDQIKVLMATCCKSGKLPSFHGGSLEITLTVPFSWTNNFDKSSYFLAWKLRFAVSINKSSDRFKNSSNVVVFWHENRKHPDKLKTSRLIKSINSFHHHFIIF